MWYPETSLKKNVSTIAHKPNKIKTKWWPMWKCLRAITREITESERGKGWFKRERGGKVREI